MIKECLPKVGIKVIKIFQVRVLAVINPYSVFKFLILNILVSNINHGCLPET